MARNKSLALALRQVTVKDPQGQEVDLTDFIGSDELDAEAAGDEGEHIASPTDAEGSGSSPSSASSASAQSAESADSAATAE